MAKDPLPTDMEDMKELSAEFNELVSWKVMVKLDEIEHHRKKAAEQDRARRQKLENQKKEGVAAI